MLVFTCLSHGRYRSGIATQYDQIYIYIFKVTFVFVRWFMQVSPSELAQIMRGLGDKLSDEEIELLVKVADKDGDGTISIEE